MTSLWSVFPPLAAVLFGIVMWVCAATADRQRASPASLHNEAATWWRLVWPLFAGALVFAFLCGWALRETNPTDEWTGVGVHVLAGLVFAVFLRALFRAMVSLWVARHIHAPIATVGIVRRRIMVADSLKRTANPEVLTAALAHEAAHAFHRDPLRIWAAQFVTDLQFPSPGARLRFKRWRLALEIRRDDEAIAAGASPIALAEAILLATRLQHEASSPPQAAITGNGEGLTLRVRRLLRDDIGASEGPMPGNRYLPMYAAGALLTALWLGTVYGDALLTLVPGVRR